MWAGKRPRAEVTVRLPADPAGGEAEVTGGVVNSTDPAGDLAAVREVMAEVRYLLRDGADRRRAFRVPTDWPVRLTPVTKAGGVSAGRAARCVDLSAGGFKAAVNGPALAGYVYAEFPGHPDAAGYALLARVVRADGAGAAAEFFTAD